MTKKQSETPAQVLFRTQEVLTERPPFMAYDAYRKARRIQSKLLSRLFKPKQGYRRNVPINPGYNAPGFRLFRGATPLYES